MMRSDELEEQACTPLAVEANGFNPVADLPYALKTDHIKSAMEEFVDMLGFINRTLRSRGFPRLESFLMPANFSSLVSEFMQVSIPKYCKTIVKNQFHNGHPDLIPRGMFPDDAVQHTAEGIEIKGSRKRRGWQGHNPENVWLMVFIFSANSSSKKPNENPPQPFRFVEVLGAPLSQEDWRFSGRSATSRRTITASVIRTGYEKMAANWIYRSSG